ncbi:hypothetical protein MLD52_06885 [Puniceicoccaceae bacterium K14]|nr:hypothetical protein [Puniceicoccaceae bacterium K14]
MNLKILLSLIVTALIISQNSNLMLSAKAQTNASDTLGAFNSSIEIIEHPSFKSITTGETLSLSAFVSTSESVNLQWYRDNEKLEGATSFNLTISNTTPSDSGWYHLELSEPNGSKTLTDKSYVLVSPLQEPINFSWVNKEGTLYDASEIKVVGEYFFSRGYLAYSIDGLNWQYTNQVASSYTYGGGFYLVSDSGSILRSVDLQQWEEFDTSFGTVKQFAYGNGTFVATAPDGIWSSFDHGQTWSRTLSKTFSNKGSVAFGENQFLCSTSTGLYQSSDGANWTLSSSSQQTIGEIAFQDNSWWMWNLDNDSQVYKSDDGIQWTVYTSEPTSDLIFDPIADKAYGIISEQSTDFSFFRGNSLYEFTSDGPILISGLRTSLPQKQPGVGIKNNQIILSTEHGSVELENFDPEDLLIGDPPGWWYNAAISYANETIIAASSYGNLNRLHSSVDGSNWTLQSTNTQEENLQYGQFVYANGIYVGQNHSGTSLATLKVHNRSFDHVVAGKGTFIGIKEDQVLYSTDGELWSEIFDIDVSVRSIVHGREQFVGYSRILILDPIDNEEKYYSQFSISTNAIDWNIHLLDQDLGYGTLHFANNVFLFSAANAFFISNDAITWQRIEGDPLAQSRRVFSSENSFFATDSLNRLFESENGVNWEQRVLSLPNSSYANYIAAKDSIITSTDKGIGITGSFESNTLYCKFKDTPKSQTIIKGTATKLFFDAFSSSSGESTLSIIINGELVDTLQIDSRQYTFQPTSPGRYEITITIETADGKTAQDTIVVNSIPISSTDQIHENAKFNDAIFFKGAFYLASDGGQAHISQDGINWSIIQTPVYYDLTSIHEIGGNLVIGFQDYFGVDYSNRGILFSADGVTWKTVEGFNSGQLVKSNDFLFSYNSQSGHLVSLDGFTWYSINTGNSVTSNQTTTLDSFDWAPYFDLTNRESYPPNNVTVSSPKGTLTIHPETTYRKFEGTEIYVQGNTDAEVIDEFPLTVSGDEIIIATTSRTFNIRQNDGSWLETPKPGGADYPVYANGVFLARDHKTLFRSTGGETWDEIPWNDVFGNENPSIHRIIPEGDRAFRILANIDGTEVVARSVDGVNWTTIQQSNISEPERVILFNDKLIAPKSISGDVHAIESTDFGETWNIIDSLGNDLNYPVNTETAAAFLELSSNSIYISTNGENWSKHSLPVSGEYVLTATNSTFYLHGPSLWSSTNGIDWTNLNSTPVSAITTLNEVFFHNSDGVLIDFSKEDIAIIDPQFTDKEYGIGDVVTISATIKNSGLTTIPALIDKKITYTLANETNRWSLDISENGIQKQQNASIPELASGDTHTISISYTIPENLQPGNYFLSLHIDSNTIQNDGNLSNNHFFLSGDKPLTIPTRQLNLGNYEGGLVTGITSQNELAWKKGISLNAIPSSGYTFQGWQGDYIQMEPNLSFKLENNISVYPVFKRIAYRLTTQTSGNGQIIGLSDSKEIYHGDILSLTASPAEGWEFNRWEGNINSNTALLTSRISADINLKAVFSQSYEHWAESIYGDDPQKTPVFADPNNTGKSNLEAYAMGLFHTTQQTETQPGIFFDDEQIRIRYTLSQNTSDIELTPYTSTNLMDWSENELDFELIGETKNLTIWEATTTSPKAFLKFHILKSD